MKRITISVLHKLPHRVRFKLSNKVNDTNIFFNNIKGELEDVKVSYSPLINTLLVQFNPNEILLQEMINRVATAYSISNGMEIIRLTEGEEIKSLNSLSIYSGTSILISGINNLFNGGDIYFQSSMNWFSMWVTLAAIIEHANNDIKRKGVFDIEILPAFYILKSFLKTPNITLVGLMWLTTFGRHILTASSPSKEVKVFRIKDEKKDGCHYVTNISEDNSVNNLSDAFHHVFYRQNKFNTKLSEKYITMSQN